MNQYCFICNTKTMQNGVNIFGENAILPSRTHLVKIISEIIDKPVLEENIHSKVICKKCHKRCTEYDCIKVRLRIIKSDLRGSFKNSLPRHKLDYATYNANTEVILGDVPTTPVEKAKRLVLPVSKLQPLPPDFVIKAGNWALPKRPGLAGKPDNPEIRILSPSTLNLKVTVGTSVLTQSIKTTGALTNKVLKNPLNPTIKILKSSIMTPFITTATSVMTSSMTPVTSVANTSLVTSLPKDFYTLSGSAFNMGTDKVNMAKVESTSDTENNEQSMDIDEDCSMAIIRSEHENKLEAYEDVSDKKFKIETEKGDSFLDMSLIQGLEEARQDQLLLSKFQILDGDDGDDEEEHTIVMDGENGSIIRVMSGQKFLYGDGKISLVVPEEGFDDSGNGDDSNDESQIELQVSGDEETANAIIAAAQEQGGAFIKVESGEMFRVESIQSKTETTVESPKEEMTMDSIASQQTDGMYKCFVCAKEGKEDSVEGNATNLCKHLREVHDIHVHSCGVCGALIREKEAYLDHLDKHAIKELTEKNKVHECAECNKKYTSKPLLAEHMNIHTGARPYQCTMCDKTFASKYTHQSHLKTHLDRPRPFKCDQCGKSFLTQQNLTQHEKTHSGVKDFICKVCGKAFGTQHNLKVHGVVHSGSRPFVCGVCGKAFARRAEVRDHMRIHTGERPFSCEICGASFTQRSNLHSHRRATHLDDKRYKCQLCPKRFKRRRLLDYHVKASHTGERPLQCEICRVSFVYPEHYKKHLRIHSGEKPYMCEVCGKSFNSRDNRNTHRFVHSDKKPYECLVCGAGYMRKQLLYHHMNTSGHLAESIVVNQPRVTKVPQNVQTPTAVVLETQNGVTPTPTVSESIFGAAAGLQLQTTEKADDQEADGNAKVFISNDKIIIHDGKSTLNLVSDNSEGSLLTYNIDDSKADSILNAVTTDPLVVDAQSSESVVTDSEGVLRLVQVRLADGRSGWLAVDS